MYSKGKKESGAIVVEASIVLPIFIFTIYTILSIVEDITFIHTNEIVAM